LQKRILRKVKSHFSIPNEAMQVARKGLLQALNQRLKGWAFLPA
jgi:hypothetical protein